jgi:hypothetical protein
MELMQFLFLQKIVITTLNGSHTVMEIVTQPFKIVTLGVKTLMNRQSSSPSYFMLVNIPVCGATAPSSRASRIPSHGSAGCGA